MMNTVKIEFDKELQAKNIILILSLQTKTKILWKTISAALLLLNPCTYLTTMCYFYYLDLPIIEVAAFNILSKCTFSLL